MADEPTEETSLLTAGNTHVSDVPEATSYDAVENAENVVESSQMSRHMLAAWIVDNTMRGAPLTNFSSLPRTLENRRTYLFFENTSWIRQLAVFGLIMLSFFELPSYCSATQECVSKDGSSLYLSGVPYLSAFEVQATNAILIGILIFFSLFDAFKLPDADLHVRSNSIRALHFLLVVDWIYVASYGGYPPFRPAPYLRALLPLFYWTSLRECTTAVLATVRPFLDAFFICALFTLLFGWIVTLMFHDAKYADRYFGNLTVGLYSAFTSLTTADWPMQVMAILDVSRPSAFLFIGFIVIGVFLLFNVLLAVVYNAYTGHMEELVLNKLRKRRQSLGLAYDVLTSDDGTCGPEDVHQLFNELRKNKRHSELDEERVEMVFTALDDDENKTIDRGEFLDIIKVLQLKFIVELESKSPMEKYLPGIYETSFWQSVSNYVRSRSIVRHMAVVMIANVAVVVWESTMDLRKTETSQSIEFYATLEVLFSCVYCAEMGLKILCYGWDRFWKDYGNRFDLFITFLLLLGAAYVLFPFNENDPEIVRYLLIIRCLRLVALLADIPRFRRIVQVFSLLIPASVPLFTFFFLSLYIFAAAGVEMFGGLIYKGNPALDPEKHSLVDAFVGNDYWTLNFNDMAAGWHTLFSAVIVGYLTEVAEAIASASRFGDWTKWFFIASFVVNTLVVSNCVIAFVVDLFVMEDEKDDDWLVDSVELESRYGAKRVRILQERTSAEQVYASMFREKVKHVFEQTS